MKRITAMAGIAAVGGLVLAVAVPLSAQAENVGYGNLSCSQSQLGYQSADNSDYFYLFWAPDETFSSGSEIGSLGNRVAHLTWGNYKWHYFERAGNDGSTWISASVYCENE
jgi:hypothetical protein